MTRLYYSNFIEKLTDGKRSALYHKLSGNFMIFPDINSINLIDNAIEDNKDTLRICQNTLDRLIREGFILEKFINQEEERLSFDDYYIVANKNIFSTWIKNQLEISIPTSKNIERIKLSKNDGMLWLKISENDIKLGELESKFINFINISNYRNCIFRLVPKEKINEKIIFSNLYLSEFYKLDDAKRSNHPTSLYIKLTDCCNLNCKMCGQANNKKLGIAKSNNYIDLDRLKEFIEPVIQDLQFINLWGGEPLLHPQIIEFIRYFSEHKKYISIATNGTLLKKYAKQLVELGVDEVVVSLDGPEKIHNDIRGTRSAFEDVRLGIEEIANIKNYMNIKPKVFLNCTVTEENIDYLHELLLICKEWNVNKLMYQLPMFITEEQGLQYSDMCKNLWGITPISWRGFSKKYDLNLDKLYDFYCNVTTNYPYFVDFYNISFDKKDKLIDYFNKPDECIGKSKCITLNSALVIEANGDLVTCPDFPDIKYKNIESTNYYDFWNSKIRKEFIQGFNDNNGYSICKRCCQFV